MVLIREYRPEDEQQVEDCFIELQEFERQIEPRRIEGKLVAKKYLQHLSTGQKVTKSNKSMSLR